MKASVQDPNSDCVFLDKVSAIEKDSTLTTSQKLQAICDAAVTDRDHQFHVQDIIRRAKLAGHVS